jgi:hypothetical protein
VATLGVIEVENSAIFEKMQPKAKVTMTVSDDVWRRRDCGWCHTMRFVQRGNVCAPLNSTLQVESVMKEAIVAAPMMASEALPVLEISLAHLARASGSMENNLRVRACDAIPGMGKEAGALCVCVWRCWQIRLAEERIAEEELLADIAIEEDDDGEKRERSSLAGDVLRWF